MARVDFYHLQNKKLEEVLPKILEKAYETGKNVKIKVGTTERVEFLNSALWTYDEESFIPHGTKKDGNADIQPIYLSDSDDNPNSAEFLFLVDGAMIEDLGDFSRVFNIFDGDSSEALTKAREFWKELKASGENELFYWQMDAKSGRWEQKA